MFSPAHYLNCAAECADLATIAPTAAARVSFMAAAKKWAMLASLVQGGSRPHRSFRTGHDIASDAAEIRRQRSPFRRPRVN
jgi:hypothetical protein